MKSVEDYQKDMHQSFRWRYDNDQDAWSADPGLLASAQKVNELAQAKNWHVLDIGIGAGNPAVALLQAGHGVVGVDLFSHKRWPLLLDHWQDKLTLTEQDFNDWQYVGEKFDAALDNGCMHHQHPDLYPHYLQKVNGLLKPDGYFVLNTYLELNDELEQGHIEYTDNNRICKYFTVPEITQLFADHGFQVLEYEKIFRPNMDEYYLLITARVLKE